MEVSRVDNGLGGRQVLLTGTGQPQSRLEKARRWLLLMLFLRLRYPNLGTDPFVTLPPAEVCSSKCAVRSEEREEGSQEWEPVSRVGRRSKLVLKRSQEGPPEAALRSFLLSRGVVRKANGARYITGGSSGARHGPRKSFQYQRVSRSWSPARINAPRQPRWEEKRIQNKQFIT